MFDFFIGLHYLLDGFLILTKPGLKRYVIIPFIFNLLFFVGMLILLIHFMQMFNAWFAHFLPIWLQWLENVLWIFFFFCFFLFFIYSFVILANIIAAPFNSFLSEKVECYLTNTSSKEKSTLLENIKDVPRIIGRQLAIIIYYIPRVLLLFMLFFIPVIQIFAALLWFMFNAWFMTLTYIDYPTDNHRVSFQEMRVWLKPRFSKAMGLGLSILIASMIPIVNFFIMPAAVAAATKFWLEEKS